MMNVTAIEIGHTQKKVKPPHKNTDIEIHPFLTLLFVFHSFYQKKKFEWTCISSVLWISSHAFIQVTFPDQFHFQSNPKQTKKLILPNSTFQLSESKLCVVQLHTIAQFAAESNLFRVCDRMWICCCYLHSKEKKNRGKCTFSFDRNETAKSNLIEFEQNHTHHK